MKTVSRRRALTLASSLVAAPLLNSIDSLAQPGAPATVFDIANFTAASPDHDAAFAKAVAAISEAAAEAKKAAGRLTSSSTSIKTPFTESSVPSSSNSSAASRSMETERS